MLLAAAAMWSVSGVAVKVARMDAIAFAFYRSLAAAGVMLALLALLPPARRLGRPPRAGWGLASALLYTVVVSLLILSMTVSTAATGILLQYTGPVFCALFAWLFQGRRMGARTLGVMALATAGIAVMVVGGWQAGNWLGPASGLASGAAFGALILVLEKNDRAVAGGASVNAGPRGAGGGDAGLGRAGGGVNPLALVLLNNFGAAVLLLPICVATGVLAATPAQLAIVGATGVFQLAVPYVLFQLALRRVRPVDASLLILLEPVLNPVWVALATSERPDAATLVGGAAILVAMVIEAAKVGGSRRPVAGDGT